MLANPSSIDCAVMYHGQTVHGQLQPKSNEQRAACSKGTAISPMSALCRVYMLGTNAKGLPNDTAAVLMAFTYGRELNLLGQEPLQDQPQGFHDKMGYIWNQTLPYGFFSRSPLGPVTGQL